MRYTITKIRKHEYEPFYLGKTLTIQSWFLEKQEIPRVNEVELIGISEKAMNFRIGNKDHWIPSSLITITERKEKPLLHEDIFDCGCESCVSKQRLHIKKMNEATE